MINVISELSKLTTIPEKALDKLFKKINYCVSDAVIDTALEGNDVVECDLGFGTLLIKLEDNSVKYRFVPSAKFDEDIKNSIVYKQNLLENVVENALVDKILNTYKDII